MSTIVLPEKLRGVLDCLANGMDVPESGRQLHLSPRTVNAYRYELYLLLEASNSAHAVHIAHTLGML